MTRLRFLSLSLYPVQPSIFSCHVALHRRTAERSRRAARLRAGLSGRAEGGRDGSAVQDAGDRKAQVSDCQIAPDAVRPVVGADHPARHLAGFSGFLQADGYTGFDALYDPARSKPGPIIEVACWAHCRRKIFDVWEATKSPVAKEALDRIAAIYAIETKARFAPPAERVAHRTETAPLRDAFFAWADATLTKLSAKSELAKAFRYILKRRVQLLRFVTDGRLEADNNIAENAMRAVAVGRKNYLFAGSDAGGERAAAIYTIVQTARINGLSGASPQRLGNSQRRLR